jgi:two-component system, cell cycle sensor histidine kinase and response regulator CckA
MSDHLQAPVTEQTLIGFYADRIASGVLICAADGVIVDCNRTAGEIMRLTHDEIVGRTVADLGWLPAPLFFEDGRPAAGFGETALQELRAGGTVPTTVVGAWHDDRNEPDWILVSAHPLPHDERGRASGAVVTLTDITAQKCVETLYAGVVDELHGVLHALPDLYFRLDADGLVIDFNIGSGFDEHVTSDDFLGRRPDEFLPPEVAAGMRKARAEARLSRDVQTFEVTVETPRAGTSCFEGRHVTLPDGGAVVIVRDMTEQRRARDELARSERLYRSFFERAAVGMFLFDDRLRLTTCNDAIVAMTGLSREKLVGLDLRSLHDQRCTPALEAALRGDESAYRGPYVPTHGAAEGLFSLHAQPVNDSDGTVVGGIAVLTRALTADGDRAPLAVGEQHRPIAG